MTKIENVIYDMMMTSTGTALGDSGFGERGRAWQRNKQDYPTLESIEASPIIEIEKPEQYYVLRLDGKFVRRDTTQKALQEYIAGDTRNYTIEKESLDSTDVDYTVSLYHHLTQSLEIDELCEAFNALPCDDWDSEKAYGISLAQEKWLNKHGLVIGNTWNSYNGESNLSQVIQGANVNLEGNESNFEYPEYILLQIHQGADVRGGYTDAKLFKVATEYFTTDPRVYGDIDGVPVSTTYDGVNLLSDVDGSEGEIVPVKPDSVIELYLSEY
jgi:hypothetical protein